MCNSKLSLPESFDHFIGFHRISASLLLVLVWPFLAQSVLFIPAAIAQDLTNDDRSGISRGLERKLERKIIPALLSNDREAFRFEFSELIARVTDSTAESIEAIGKRNGIDSLRVALFDAWQDTISAGRVPADFQFKLPVLMYLTAGLEASNSKLMQEVERHELTTAKAIVEDWRQSRSFFFDVAGFKSQITELKKMEKYLGEALAFYRNSPNAKKEVGATRAMYLDGDDWFVPTSPTIFGLIEVYHVLLDDVAAHLRALETDAEFKRAIKKSLKTASSDTLSYLRRLKLVNCILVALEESGDPMIAQRASDFRKVVTDYREVLAAQVVRSTQDQTMVTRRQKTNKVRGTQTVNRPH